MEQHSKLKSEKPALLRSRSELRCSWRVSSSCYAYGTGFLHFSLYFYTFFLHCDSWSSKTNCSKFSAWDSCYILKDAINMEQHSKLKSEKPTLLRTRSELGCSWRVSSSCYAYGTGIVGFLCFGVVFMLNCFGHCFVYVLSSCCFYIFLCTFILFFYIVIVDHQRLIVPPYNRWIVI
jgi:hypothetical protein